MQIRQQHSEYGLATLMQQMTSSLSEGGNNVYK